MFIDRDKVGGSFEAHFLPVDPQIVQLLRIHHAGQVTTPVPANGMMIRDSQRFGVSQNFRSLIDMTKCDIVVV